MLEWMLEERGEVQGLPKILVGDKVDDGTDGDPGARNLFWGKISI